ncbi:MAG: trimethylamine methyltransferase family protein [Pseudomonadota bacterium]
MPRRGRLLRPLAAPTGASMGVSGGSFTPLRSAELDKIVSAAFDILEQVGIADAPSTVCDGLTARGAKMTPEGRLCFPRAIVEDAISRAPDRVDLPGFSPHCGLTIGDRTVHIGTGGAAVQMLEPDTTTYHDATLADLYALMQVLDACENIHYGVRPIIARDLEDPLELDLNTAFACLKGTGKPIGVSFESPENLAATVAMFDAALGSEGAFRAQPFCMGVIVHVVPPLRFAPEGVAVLQACVEHGMIPQICSAGQAGATSPVTLAGALAQGLAECLAGLVLVDHFRTGSPCIYALMPFVSDLRTGAMTGGGGEGAVANAAAAQVLAHVGLPSTVSAGMTDAKIVDAQAGYEKGYTVALAAHAGANMINLSVGMLGSIMVASPEAMVIDDDMCGAILRSVRGIEVSDETLDIDAIHRVATGEGHYLGEAQTLARMKTDYVYPSLADRLSVAEWQSAGSPSLWDKARARVQDILAEPPTHLPRDAEARIRAAFPIHLPE